MVAYAEVKPKTVTSAESEFDRARNAPRPGIQVTQSNKGSGSTIAYIVAAIVLLAGAYLLYTNYAVAPTVVPSVTQNNTTLPAPDVIVPAPATPPVMEQATPPAPAPATPPATAPVTP